jgi:hypothetical protein
MEGIFTTIYIPTNTALPRPKPTSYIKGRGPVVMKSNTMGQKEIVNK